MQDAQLKIVKTAIGCALSIIVSQLLGLQFPYLAAIITLLSIQDTRRKSLDVVWQRVKATVFSLAIGSLIFPLLGFESWVFAVYLLFFIPLTIRFKAVEGISTSAVLATHLLSEGFISTSLLLNEVALMAVGTIVALGANYYMPKILPKIAKDQERIEENFLEIMLHLIEKIKRPIPTDDELFEKTANLLEAAKYRADHNQENYVFSEVSYFAQYMEMRFLQFEKLGDLNKILEEVSLNLMQADGLAALTEHFIHHLHDSLHIEAIIAESERAIEDFKNHPLPQNREDFHNETLIFSYLKEFQHLLEITHTFSDHLTNEEKAIAQKLIERESTSFETKIMIAKEKIKTSEKAKLRK